MGYIHSVCTRRVPRLTSVGYVAYTIDTELVDNVVATIEKAAGIDGLSAEDLIVSHVRPFVSYLLSCIK